METKYEYDKLSRLIERTTPDEGTYRYKYDDNGNLRFVHHEQTQELLFHMYDSRNRLGRTGNNPGPMSVGDFNELEPNDSLSFETDENSVVIHQYDDYDPSDVFDGIWENFSPGNPKGRLVATAYRDEPGDDWSYKSYSYDEFGRVEDYRFMIAGKGVKTIHNEHDLLGNLTHQSIAGGLADKYYFWYTYDKQGRLIEVRSSWDPEKGTADIEAVYSYNASDQVVHRTLGTTGNALEYEYNYRGWVTQINDTTSDFVQTLSYYKNGNVMDQLMPQHWGTWDSLTFTYEYDAMNRLKESTCLGCPEYSESFTYNRDGNFTYSSRKDWTYTYTAGTNRLNRIQTIVKPSITFFDFEYDSRGNTTRIENMTDTTDTLNFRYNYQNLPVEIVNGGNDTLRYRYDENGLRVSREIPGATPEYYLRDHTGRELAIYDYETNWLKQVNIWGNGLEGKVNVNIEEIHHGGDPLGWIEWVRDDTRYYFVKDHLGSIRATIGEAGELVSARDYYPFGEILRENQGSVLDRYKFTEKERDQETNLDYFGARYYGSAIGRWLVPDRFADKYPGLSPYSYVANNPLLFIDMNGDSIYVYEMQLYDQKYNTNYLGTLIMELEKITGLSLSVNERGQLVHATDSKGNAVITTDESGNLVGSQNAREMLITGISDSNNDVMASTIFHRGSLGGGDQLGLNPEQIQGFVEGVGGGLNPMTMGMGMTFLHEFLHTTSGGSLRDPGRDTFGQTGPAVDRMNVIRSELGPSYGQRMSYEGRGLTPAGPAFIPFDRSSLRSLRAWRQPPSSSMFIRY